MRKITVEMIRIQTAESGDGISVVLDGAIAGEYVDEVERAIRQAKEQDRRVRVFLRSVHSIDKAGHALLSRFAAEGVELSATGVYSSYVVDEIKRLLSAPDARR